MKKILLSLIVVMLFFTGCGERSLPPEIIVTSKNLSVSYDSDYNPLDGVSAVDNKGVDITKDVVVVENEVETSKPGDYIVKYKVKDSSGNEATRDVYVKVRKKNVALKLPKKAPYKSAIETEKKQDNFKNQSHTNTLSSSEVYSWIQKKYDEYDVLYNKGNYSGDKYTTEIFKEASVYFNATVSEVRKAYDNFRY